MKKKGYKGIDRKELHDNTTTVTKENVKEMPKKIQEWFELIQEDKIFFPKKYYGGLKLSIEIELKQLFTKEPNKPLKDIIAKKIGGLNPIIPPEKLLELTKFIIKAWQKLQKEALVSV